MYENILLLQSIVISDLTSSGTVFNVKSTIECFLIICWYFTILKKH